MSDAIEAPETPDTPTSVEQDTPEVDYRKRYEDLRPEFDRKNQILADREAWLAHGQEHFPDAFEEAEPEEPVEDDESYDEPEYMTKAEHKAWQEEQDAKVKAKEAQDQFESDFKSFVGDRELTKYDERALRGHQYKDAAELEEAINGYFEYLDSLGGTKRKKRPTAPLPGGKTATGVPDYTDMTSDQVNAAMVERARALEAQ